MKCDPYFCSLQNFLKSKRNFLLILLLFSACAVQKKSIRKEVFISDSLKVNEVDINLMKHIDVALPVGFVFIAVENIGCTSFLSYEGRMSIGDVIGFYVRSMERYGWDLQTFITSNEAAIICQKVKKTCLIVVRHVCQSDLTYISIYIRDVECVEPEMQTECDINAKSII